MKVLRGLLIGMLFCALLFCFAVIRIQQRELEEAKSAKGALANLADDAADSIRPYAQRELARAGSVIANLRHAELEQQQASAVGALMVISVAEKTYRNRYGSGQWYADSLRKLGEAGLIDANLAGGMKNGYSFVYWRPESMTSYTVFADPVAGGALHYCTDETGIIRVEDGRRATRESRALLNE